MQESVNRFFRDHLRSIFFLIFTLKIIQRKRCFFFGGIIYTEDQENKQNSYLEYRKWNKMSLI